MLRKISNISFCMVCDVQYLVPFCILVFGYEDAATVSLNLYLTANFTV